MRKYWNWWRLQIKKRRGVALWYARLEHPIGEAGKPTNVKHAFSAGLKEGFRYYAFESVADLSTFLANNPRAESLPDVQ